MKDPTTFDEFYQGSRARLLLQGYALTGDLPAARSAVRDAFVIAWHHWRKVSRLEDPEAWVRPHAWSHAQRRHTARIWHRDKSLDPETRSTLDALGELTTTQRRLLMARITPIPLDVLAREINLPLHDATEELETAAARFALHRGIDRLEVRETLGRLETVVSTARLPRPSIIRRAGTARRRTHTAVASVAVLATLVGTGSLVSGSDGVRLSLADERLTSAPYAVRTATTDPAPRLLPRHLLGRSQVGRLAPGYDWRRATTTDNTNGDGMVLPCQRSRFADPDGRASLVRDFRSRAPGKRPAVRAVQMAELSSSEEAASAAYRTSRDWYSICSGEDLQMIATHEVRGVGDDAHVFVLRARSQPRTTYTYGIARSGLLTTTTYQQVKSQTPGSTEEMSSLLATAVNRFCGSPGAGPCASPPRTRRIPPFPASSVAGMLATVDLPPVPDVARPWVGTTPTKARINVAATRCDNARFDETGMRANRTRSFLIPEAKLPDTFGLTESVARMPSPGRARKFVERVRSR
ncbi:hypothetical protein, partial [Nocardioides sp.]|uniref:hypothetical protein n=1 Tax=Nocardioides sp. TaxID=35761 RepID=UPI0027351287